MEAYLTNHFIKYLFEIGIINGKTVTDFITTYTNIMKNETYKDTLDFKDAMCASLIYYFSSIDEEQRKTLSLNLIVKFFENHQRKKEQSLQRVLLTVYPILQQSRVIKLNSVMKKWRKNVSQKQMKYIKTPQNIQKSFSTLNLSTQYQKIKTYNHSKRNDRPSSRIKISNKKKANLSTSLISEKSWDKREREEFEQCTFNPVINQNFTRSSIGSNIPVYERLYKDKEKYDTRKQIKAIEIEHFFSKENPFKPELVSSKRYNKNNNGNFIERQESFFTNKSKHFDDLITQSNDNVSQNCSFIPQTNHSRTNSRKSSNNPSPMQTRIYNNYINKKAKPTKEKRLSKSFIENPKIDYQRIESLYKEFKKKSKNKGDVLSIPKDNAQYHQNAKEEITKKIMQRLVGNTREEENKGIDTYTTKEDYILSSNIESMNGTNKVSKASSVSNGGNNNYGYEFRFNEPRDNLYIEDFYLNYNK